MGYTQHSNPFSRRSSSPLNKTWDEAYDEIQDPDHELHGTYGEMDRAEYIKEAKRQAGVYKQSGGTIEDGVATGGTKWDAPVEPITESKNESNVSSFAPVISTTSSDEDTGDYENTYGRKRRAQKKVKRIQKRIDKRPFGKDARPGQLGRLAKAEAKAAGKSGKDARKAGRDARLKEKYNNAFDKYYESI